MMNFKIFKEAVAKKIMDYMSGQYKDMQLEIRPVDKANVLQTQITFIKSHHSNAVLENFLLGPLLLLNNI